MYTLSVGSVFRNEAHSIKEWIEHYLYHGFEHIYLIDDGSDDDSCAIVEPYVKRGLVTLFNAKWDRYLGRQRDMYNHYILPCLGSTRWLLMCDMDEYVWSPQHIDLKKVLASCGHIGQIQVNHTLFGSSYHDVQPESIVGSFTRRAVGSPTHAPGNSKYFVNSDFKFTSLNIHHATFVDKADEDNKFLLLNEPYFKMNHYSCQSREFWLNVKCKRGDGDFWRQRNDADFALIDQNDVFDDGLLLQNMPLLEKLGYKLE
jgi:glycosyltransferase involved in cell wall biosynthesis